MRYAARVQPLRAMLQRGQDRFNELVFFVEPSFLKIFPVSILSGSREPLAQPYSIMISERMAKKYFGDANPIGKTLSIGGARELTVSAVMSNWPPNSHIRPEFLIPLNTFFSIVASGKSQIPKASITGWSNCHCYVTYMLFNSPSSLALAQEAVQPLLVSEQGAAYAARFPITLQPLRDIYLGSAQYAAVAIGCPIAWLIAARWLNGFVMRAPISVTWFVAGGLAIAAISFAALFAFTLRLTAGNPADSIRSE
ncbi:MAG TPA: ABC transporter permease [Gammaproteobacteria bacterium]|nr:ABC transporter permease [Gammaproteobacteria bacterium]